MANEKPRILVVDDDVEFLKALLFVFASNNCDVVTAAGPKEALGHLTTYRFDAVISDVKMPGMDGKELLLQIEKLQGFRPYVIMMSGFSLYTEEELLASGACGFLEKPFTRQQLEEVINDFIKHMTDDKACRAA